MITHQEGTSGPALAVLAVIVLLLALPWLLQRLNTWLQETNDRLDAKLRERRREDLRRWCAERGIEPRDEDIEMAIEVSLRRRNS